MKEKNRKMQPASGSLKISLKLVNSQRNEKIKERK